MSELVHRPAPTVDAESVQVSAEANNGWQVVDRCFHPPGYCVLCGDWERERFVDFHTKIKAASGQPGPVDPHAYICEDCIAAAYRLLYGDQLAEAVEHGEDDALERVEEAISILKGEV